MTKLDASILKTNMRKQKIWVDFRIKKTDET